MLVGRASAGRNCIIFSLTGVLRTLKLASAVWLVFLRCGDARGEELRDVNKGDARLAQCSLVGNLSHPEWFLPYSFGRTAGIPRIRSGSWAIGFKRTNL